MLPEKTFNDLLRLFNIHFTFLESLYWTYVLVLFWAFVKFIITLRKLYSHFDEILLDELLYFNFPTILFNLKKKEVWMYDCYRKINNGHPFFCQRRRLYESKIILLLKFLFLVPNWIYTEIIFLFQLEVGRLIHFRWRTEIKWWL